MPPKRKAATPPPRKAVKSKSGQTSINNFFASPSKPKIGDQKKRSTSVISIIDSDDELPPQDVVITGGDDEKVARELQEKFDTEVKAVSPDKGKGREIVQEDDDDDDGIEIVKEEVHVKKEGINGSSSSKVHPMFAPVPVKTPIKPEKEPGTTVVKAEPGNGTSNGSPAKITTSSAEAVEPIDFDVDQFLFRPSEVDVSKWPKGRLPYSVLVGVYVQVSSTRSRLLIVRVLTKYVFLHEVDLRLIKASYTSYYMLPQSTLHQHSTCSPTTYSPPTSPASSELDHKS